MSKLTAALTARGADMSGAMDRFLKDEALYDECFRLFLSDANFTALGDALARQDTAAAFDAAHTLKGVAGNLGLTALYQTLCAIVEPLRQGQIGNVEALYAAMLEERASLAQLSDD